MKASATHRARKALFQQGIQRGALSLGEIDAALPGDALTPAERWLLFYSLRAAGVEIRDDDGVQVPIAERPPDG
ncbi:MAG TPA: hypothetical protein VFE30_08065 [Anaeromyxobacteraceae bacterium]|nr:hypothetical protein [Anaeromyxobacteraceae bacterium]